MGSRGQVRAQVGEWAESELLQPIRPELKLLLQSANWRGAPAARPHSSTVPAHRLTGLQVGPASWSKKVRAPKGSDPPNEAGGLLLTPRFGCHPRPYSSPMLLYLSPGPTPLPQALSRSISSPQPLFCLYAAEPLAEVPTVSRAKRSSLEDALFCTPTPAPVAFADCTV